jgi:ferritin-like metal-binding protein YciE
VIAQPYLESTTIAALESLGNALDCHGDMSAQVQRHILVAYEQVRALQEMLDAQRQLLACAERAHGDSR